VIRIAVKSVVVRWSRALGTSLAVVVGVGVVSGTLIVSDTADRVGIRNDGLAITRTVLPIAGGVALLVGGFIVNLTMTVTVAQRTQELGLLRCLGATARQVRRVVVVESLTIGAVAALLGLGAGFGVAAALRRLINTEVFPGDLPGTMLVLAPRTIAAALLIGCAVTTLSGWAVARRAGRIAPLAAMRDAVSAGSERPGRTRIAIGAAACSLTAAAIAVAVATGRGPLLLPAAVLALVGVRLPGPSIAPALAKTLGWPVARLLRLPGELGTRNAARHPYRFAAVASAILIGVALMTQVTVILTSVRVAMVSELARYRADYEVTIDRDGAGLPPDTVARLAARPEFAAVLPERCTPGAVVAGEELVCADDPTGLVEMFDLEVVAGQLSGVETGGIAVTEGQAAAEGWTLGSQVTIHLPAGTKTFPVTAIYRGFYYLGAPIIAPNEYTRLGGDPVAQTVYLQVADRVDPAHARTAIEEATTGADAAIRIRSRDEVGAAALDQIDGATWVYRALTGLAIMVGLSGIVNVLALSIVERKRELALLRAIGLDRSQVRTTIRAEATVIATVGVSAGIGLGLLFGWATTRVLEHASQPIRFTLPAGTLAVIALGAIVASLIAAVLPAAWAGRLPLLRAE